MASKKPAQIPSSNIDADEKDAALKVNEDGAPPPTPQEVAMDLLPPMTLTRNKASVYGQVFTKTSPKVAIFTSYEKWVNPADEKDMEIVITGWHGGPDDKAIGHARYQMNTVSGPKFDEARDDGWTLAEAGYVSANGGTDAPVTIFEKPVKVEKAEKASTGSRKSNPVDLARIEALEAQVLALTALVNAIATATGVTVPQV